MKVDFSDRDNGVAVVIGALLTFVIVITLLGSYVLWYVPSNGQQLDQKFLSDTENSLLQLQNKLDNSSASPNEFVIQSFPLGIAGTPPFSQNSFTSINFENNSSQFNSSLSFSLVVDVTYGGALHLVYSNYTFYSSGEIVVDATTPFITPSSFHVQDSAIVQGQTGSNYYQMMGFLPFNVKNTTSGIYINATELNITGNQTSLSGYGTTIMTLQYSYSNLTDEFHGETISTPNGTGGFTSAVVDGINLTAFNYTVNGSQVQAWNNTVHSIYGIGKTSAGNVSNGLKWNFADKLPFTAYLRNNSFSVYLNETQTPRLNLYGAGLNYFVIRMLNL